MVTILVIAIFCDGHSYHIKCSDWKKDRKNEKAKKINKKMR